MRGLALSLSAAALLAACGGSQPSIGAPGAIPQSRTIATHAQRDGSWMLPAAMNVERLLYVSDWFAFAVQVYNYDTGQEVGTLTSFDEPAGQCVDKNGNIWITEFGQEEVVEYAHGGDSPIKTLVTDGPGIGCAIDPTTGNLAVVNFKAGSGSDVQIWKNASGLPTDYSNEQNCYEMWSPGYDKNGNLYAENGNPNSACELPVDGSSLGAVSFDHTIHSAGGVMWDGKYLAFTDQAYKDGINTAIYQVKPTAHGLKVVGKTVLRAKPCGAAIAQPFIVGKKNTPVNHEQGTTVVGANPSCYYEYSLDYWNYPAGGHPVESLYQQQETAEGVSVSIKI